MAFGTGVLTDPNKVAGGERYSDSYLVLTATTFQDNLKVGRFAKLDTGSIDNFDGSATPVVAGVVLRNVASPVEDDDAINSDLYGQVEYLRQGLVTVGVKAGETPAQFGKVYISNAGDANDGLATATNTDVVANAEFVEEVATNVWLVYVTPAPGDVATHIGDATGAHAASAISVVDAGSYTSNTNVETVTQELLITRPVLLADTGDAGAIPVTRSGNFAITTGATGETRTMAIPAVAGITISLSMDVDGGGDAVVTVASAINQTGNNTITFGDAGDTVILTAVQVAGALVWRVVVNDGASLTTV